MNDEALVFALQMRNLPFQMNGMAIRVLIFPRQLRGWRMKLSLARDDRQGPGFRVLDAEFRERFRRRRELAENPALSNVSCKDSSVNTRISTVDPGPP